MTGALKQTGLVVPVELSDKSGGPYTVFNAGVSLRYTLFDFGQRSAPTPTPPNAKQLAADLTFTATHQTVTFQVTQAYYTLETTRRLIEAAEISAASASDILAATQDKSRVRLGDRTRTCSRHGRPRRRANSTWSTPVPTGRRPAST